MNDIKFEVIHSTGIEEAVGILDAKLLIVLDKHAPMKERRVAERERERWYEDHVKHQKTVVRCRELK